MNGNGTDDDGGTNDGSGTNDATKRLLRSPFLAMLLCMAACRSHAADEPATASGTAPASSPTAPSAPAPAGAPEEVAVPVLAEPTNGSPVVAGATLTPARVRAGGTTELTVHVRTAAAWHIYPRGEGSGPNAPTDFDFELPAGCEWDGDWSDPAALRDPVSGARVLHGTLAFRRRIRVGGNATTGVQRLHGSMAYQTCDPFMCRPPEKIALEVEFDVGGR